jgi:cytochrome c
MAYNNDKHIQEVDSMKFKTVAAVTVVILAVLSGPFATAFAGEKATPEEVYELILKAVPVLQKLGDAGLEAFKDPKGEFVYKDTYVLVEDCEKRVIVAHPNSKLVGYDTKNNVDKNPDPAKRKNQDTEMCQASENPNGGWVEYYWEKLGESTPVRKISFAIKAPGTEYTLIAGIYDNKTSVEALNAKLK